MNHELITALAGMLIPSGFVIGAIYVVLTTLSGIFN